MKKALVLSLFVMLGVGVACSAQLQGTWDTWLKLDLTPFQLNSFYSFLDIQYLVGGWTLEAATIIDAAGLDNIWFEAYGSLGAFSAWSLVYFNPNPTTPAFVGFENGAEVSIAGVDIYALFGILPVGAGWGSGFALGGIGTAGDIRIGAEITWNLNPNLWFIFLYGLNGGVTDWTYTGCASDIWYPYWYIGALGAVQSGCDVVFSYITAIAEFPICCADVYVMAEFSCTGFDFLSFLAKNIDIGLDWLKIYELGITYDIDSKDIGFAFQIVTGDVLCFKPYFTIITGSDGYWTLDGIQLTALTLTCTVGGCEFYWGHIFDHWMMRYSGWMWPTNPSLGGPYVDDYYFGALGVGLVRSPMACVWSVYDSVGAVTYYPNEVFGIQCDEDSCCGGLFSFGVSNFFRVPAANEVLPANLTGIFGWMGTYVELTIGVGSNVSLVGGMNVTNLNGVEFITMGVQVAW
ncbi:MAG: hypothetical protein NTY63_04550 [Candidatus Bipolaricaulota bacterium]|nr:hypothetical protein [Candidatus Bipolaricaulota bacterium]